MHWRMLPYIFLQSGLLSSISCCVTRTCQQLRKCYGNRFCESNQRDEQEETRTHFQSSASLSGSLSLVDCCSVVFVSVPLMWNKSQDLMWRNPLSRYCKCRHKRFGKAVKNSGAKLSGKAFLQFKNEHYTIISCFNNNNLWSHSHNFSRTTFRAC